MENNTYFPILNKIQALYYKRKKERKKKKRKPLRKKVIITVQGFMFYVLCHLFYLIICNLEFDTDKQIYI